MGGICSAHGVMKNACKVMIRKRELKRPLEIPRRRWEDNIKMDLRGNVWGRGLDS
jgi:hypothetical protein